MRSKAAPKGLLKPPSACPAAADRGDIASCQRHVDHRARRCRCRWSCPAIATHGSRSRPATSTCGCPASRAITAYGISERAPCCQQTQRRSSMISLRRDGAFVYLVGTRRRMGGKVSDDQAVALPLDAVVAVLVLTDAVALR